MFNSWDTLCFILLSNGYININNPNIYIEFEAQGINYYLGVILVLTSLISPTSKFLLSTMLPFVSADPSGPGGPAFTGAHGDGMVPGPTAISKLKKKSSS